MDILSEYSGGIKENLQTKLGFLSKSAPDISDLIRCNSSVGKKTSAKRKSIPDQPPSWFRIRPVRRVSYKYSEGSDSDEDYSPSPKNRFQHKTRTDTEVDVEELDNVERRLGLNKRPNQYGSIEEAVTAVLIGRTSLFHGILQISIQQIGVVVGQWWRTRMECSFAGVHRPTVAGIHAGPNGAYSIALSGGYEGDYDAGDEFTYTGEGGRDLKGTKANPKNLRTAPQSKDQELTRGNLALHTNFENRFPVRVVRGYKLHGDYAPEDGYRYDGLYQVVKCWNCIGSSGFLIYKFHFVRCQDQLPLVDSVDNMLLFSSIKKELYRREEIRRRQSNSASDESFDEDMDDSRLLPKDEEKENSSLFYIEDCDSPNMFYKGKFLGWSKAESFEESAKKFRNTLCKLEDSMTEGNFSGDDVTSDVEEMDGSFLGWKTANSCDKYLKKFQSVIGTLEDSMNEDMKTVSDSENLSYDENLCESSTSVLDRSCRRKGNAPRKVVRFSIEKPTSNAYPLAG